MWKAFPEKKKKHQQDGSMCSKNCILLLLFQMCKLTDLYVLIYPHTIRDEGFLKWNSFQISNHLTTEQFSHFASVHFKWALTCICGWCRELCSQTMISGSDPGPMLRFPRQKKCSPAWELEDHKHPKSTVTATVSKPHHSRSTIF